MNNIKIKKKCSGCSKEYEITNDNLKSKVPIKSEGRDFLLTYFQCECGEINCLQIDTTKTMEYLKLSERTVARAVNGKYKGKSSQPEKARYELFSKRLRSLREELTKFLNGKKFELDGKEYEFKFN